MYEVKETFVRAMTRVPGILREPVGHKSEIAILIMHGEEDYLDFVAGPELAKRGFATMGANTDCEPGKIFTLPDKMKNVKACVKALKDRGYEKVLLFGHSGGATLTSTYQALSENGPEVFSTDNYLWPFIGEEMPKTDGIMLIDANWGNSAMGLFSIDPAVTDERSGLAIDESLNLHNPANGFDPNGSTYSDEFIRRYQRAQGERYNRLIDYALERMELIRAGKGFYNDDEPLIIPGAAQIFMNNKLYAQDIRLMSHTRKPHTLLHPDGSRTEEIVRSLRGPENPVSLTGSFYEAGQILTLKTFLSSNAIRTSFEFGYDEDTVYGVDWDSCYASAVSNVSKIKVPTLVMGMTAGWEFAASETIFDRSASTNKTIAYVKGATHMFNPAKHLEKTPGQFGDTIKTLFDFAAEWLQKLC